MSNKIHIEIQKYYLFLNLIKNSPDAGRTVVTNGDIEKKLTKNLNLWVNLKSRKVSDERAFVDGTLAELYSKNYIKRVNKGEYRITETGIYYFYELQEILIENYDFEFPMIPEGLSEVQAYEAIVVNKKFEYSPAQHEILTLDNVAQLALEDYQNINEGIEI
ncbi:hypothetical protein [Lysinibacillus antri]|uniref:Uncharacterized protein n=1 Tax=Lysinibacillus antri TaxID=2498145 RepID=A0A432L8C6_9BACI|nr:hypothetical protein [Lysinibacillus antri]RUL48814.1 hypothetical protein EK386_16395 [Lysinibacillus antri]